MHSCRRTLSLCLLTALVCAGSAVSALEPTPLPAVAARARPEPRPAPPAQPPQSRQDSLRSSDVRLPQEPAFRSTVDLVLHSVAVLDANGRPVTGLTANDFRVEEDDRVRDIDLFLAPDSAPLDVGLVLDSSASLFYSAKVVRRAAQTFLTRLDVLDCVYLLPFNEQVGPGRWGRAFDPALGGRIEGIFMEGGTALYDALYHGLTTIDAVSSGVGTVPGQGDGTAHDGAAGEAGHQEAPGRAGCGPDISPVEAGRPQRRRALVLLSDGADRHSNRRFDEVLDAARAVSIPVFPVVLGEARDDERLRANLNQLAGSTGGMVVSTINPEMLPKAYDDIVVMLRASYLLGYRPDDDDEQGQWRNVSVRSRRPSYRLVYRGRYFR